MIESWEKLKEKEWGSKYRRLLTRTFRLQGGKIDDYDVHIAHGTICVVPLTSDNKVILAKQFRPGPEKVLLELPGGGLEAGEEPIEGIERELLEETGYKGNIKLVGTCLEDGYSTMIRYVFVAIDCKKVQEQELDENEFIEVVEMPLEDFREHLRSGELSDVDVGYLGLDYLGLL